MLVPTKQDDDLIVCPYLRKKTRLRHNVDTKQVLLDVILLERKRESYTRKEYRAKLKEICKGDMILFHKYHDETNWSIGMFKGE